MTFISIGALALGMWGMTYLTQGKGRKRVVASESETRDETRVIGESSAAAAAAASVAVAVALADQAGPSDALEAQAAAAAVAAGLAAQEGMAGGQISKSQAIGAWNSFVRGQHLAVRARYEARRPR
jgi:hypothetical protein